jgi:ssDNA-binding replication factor A large subunit
MIGFTYDQIVEKIKESKGLSDGEIEAKVKEKLDKLSDLISKEGAAHIVANELGVNLYDNIAKTRRYKVRELMPAMRNIEVVGKVVRVYEVRSFVRNEQERKVASFLMGDETGKVKVTLWDEPLIKNIEDGTLKEESVVLIKNAYVRENNGFREVHMGSGAVLDVNPKGEKVEVSDSAVQQVATAERKTIAELKQGDFALVYGTLINVFEPKFYDACPHCNKKVVEGKCPEHGEVKSNLVPIVNIFLDDGTDNIRVVFFRDAANKVLKVEDASVLKDNPEKFREVKDSIMLSQVEVQGKVNQNEMMGRLEMMASKVNDADPKEIAKFLQQ